MLSTQRSFTDQTENNSWSLVLLEEAENARRGGADTSLTACRARTHKLYQPRRPTPNFDGVRGLGQIFASQKRQYYAAISAQKAGLSATSVRVLAELRKLREENRSCSEARPPVAHRSKRRSGHSKIWLAVQAGHCDAEAKLGSMALRHLCRIRIPPPGQWWIATRRILLCYSTPR